MRVFQVFQMIIQGRLHQKFKTTVAHKKEVNILHINSKIKANHFVVFLRSTAVMP